jgi:molybdopterin/thiamine biosynthesis adenylyltransferase
VDKQGNGNSSEAERAAAVDRPRMVLTFHADRLQLQIAAEGANRPFYLAMLKMAEEELRYAVNLERVQANAPLLSRAISGLGGRSGL